MKNIEIYNTLNIDKDSSSIVATFTQEDDAVMEFKLFKDGQEIVLKDQTISLGAERKDGAVIEQDDGFLIKENNVLNITLKKNIIQVVGVVKIQLYLKDKSGEMASNTFNIRVNKKLLGAENVEATNDIKVLNTLVLELKNNTNKLIDDTKSKADKLLSGLQETGDNISSTVEAKTDKLIEDTKAEVNNIKKDYEGLKKVVIDENIGIKLQKDVTELQNGLKSNQALEYQGSSIDASDTLEGRTEGMRIGGRTLVNLWDIKTIDGFYMSNLNNGYFIEINKNFSCEPNTKYTVIYNEKIPTDCYASVLYKDINGIHISEGVNCRNGKVATFTTPNNCYYLYTRGFRNNSPHTVNNNGFNFIIVKGELKEAINYFEEIKSFGEAEQEGDKYKISILSSGLNRFNAKKLEEINYGEGFKLIDASTNTFQINSHKNDVDLLESMNMNLKNKTNITLSYTLKKISGRGVALFEVFYSDGAHEAVGTLSDGSFKKTLTKPLQKLIFTFSDFGVSELSNVMISETDTPTFKSYKQDKKDILIKEPLREGDYLYEDNGQVKVDRHMKQYTFTGDENNWFLQSINSHGIANFGIPILKFKTFNGMSNLFKQQTTLIADTKSEGYILAGNNDTLYIRIGSTKADTLEKFKTLLKRWNTEGNPLTVVYQLDKPVVEVVENCVDIDLDTYQDKTYFNILNSLPGELDFKVPSNIGSSLQNLAKEVNNIWDVINNLLVPGILDTKKKIAMSTIKNNLK